MGNLRDPPAKARSSLLCHYKEFRIFFTLHPGTSIRCCNVLLLDDKRLSRPSRCSLDAILQTSMYIPYPCIPRAQNICGTSLLSAQQHLLSPTRHQMPAPLLLLLPISFSIVISINTNNNLLVMVCHSPSLHD